MTSSERRWLLVSVLGTLVLQLFLCFFFSSGKIVPLTVDTNAATYSLNRFHFPPSADYSTDYWIGQARYPMGLHPLSLYAHLPFWIYATTFYPLCAALSIITSLFLFRQWGVSAKIGIYGGLVYAWQGAFLSNLYPAHFSPAFLYAAFPLAFGLVIQGLRTQAIRPWLWAGFLAGQMMLFLPDQGGLATGLILAYALYHAWFLSEDRPLAMSRTFKGLILFGIITVLIALPGIYSLSESNLKGVQQGASESPKERFAWATQWSFPPEEFLGYLVPGYYGWHNASSEGPYWGRIGQSAEWLKTGQGFRNFMLGINTYGTVPFLFTLLGLLALSRYLKSTNPTSPPLLNESERNVAVFFGGATLFLFLLGFGKYAPLYALFYKLPLMDSWRNPLKFVLLPGTFCLIALSVFGMVACVRSLAREKGGHELSDRVATLFRSFCIALFGLLPFCFLLSLVLPTLLKTLQYQPPEIQGISKCLMNSTGLAAILALGIALWITLLRHHLRIRRFPMMNPLLAKFRDQLFSPDNLGNSLILGAIALMLVQMIPIQRHYLYPVATKSEESPITKLLLEQSTPYARVKLLNRDHFLDELLQMQFPLHGIPTLDIPAASRIPKDIETFFETLNPHPARLWELTGVRYLAGSLNAWAPLISNQEFAQLLGKTHFFRVNTEGARPKLEPHTEPNGSAVVLVELKSALPRATLIPRSETFQNESELLARLADPQWNPTQSLLLSQKDSSPLPPPLSPLRTDTSSLQVLAYNGKRIEVDTQLSQPMYLLLNDRFEPEWKAEINGKPAPVLRANFVFRAVPLPAGNSKVVFRYQPTVWPVYLQLATMLVLGIAALRPRPS